MLHSYLYLCFDCGFYLPLLYYNVAHLAYQTEFQQKIGCTLKMFTEKALLKG